MGYGTFCDFCDILMQNLPYKSLWHFMSFLLFCYFQSRVSSYWRAAHSNFKSFKVSKKVPTYRNSIFLSFLENTLFSDKLIYGKICKKIRKVKFHYVTFKNRDKNHYKSGTVKKAHSKNRQVAKFYTFWVIFIIFKTQKP